MNIKEKRSVSVNVVLLIIFSFLLKGIGFLNRIVIAYKFGTTITTDIFYISSGFIDSISSILLASLTVGIINIYIEHKDNKEKTNKFLNKVLVIVEIFMFLFMCCSIFFADSIARILAPGYSQVLYDELSNSLQILSASYVLLGITNVLYAGLQAEEIFIPGKITGSIASIISIICVLFFSNLMGYKSLILAYNFTAIVNAIFILFSARKIFRFRFEKLKNYFDNDIKSLIKISAPLMIGLAAHELNLVIDKSVATSLEEGAVSALSYSSVLYLFVENIVINSIVTVIFPDLSKIRLEGKGKLLAEKAKNYIFYSEMILIPIVMVVYLQSVNIVEMIYLRGGFNENSTMLTSAALNGYIFGLLFLALRDIVTRVYYAYGHTKEPMIINLLSIIINISLDIILSRYIGIKGITLATTISLSFCSIVMLCRIKKVNSWLGFSISKRKLFGTIIIILVIIEICKQINIGMKFFSILLDLAIIMIGEFIVLAVIFPEKFKLIKRLICHILTNICNK